MNIRDKLKSGLSVATLSLSATVMAGVSIVTDPSVSMHWRTLPGREVPLEWSWPARAVSAKLTVSDSSDVKEVVFDSETTTYTWVVNAADVIPAKEKVFDLKLEFFAAEHAAGEAIPTETLEAHSLGFVGGVNGGATELRAAGKEGSNWERACSRCPVLPVLAGTTSLSVDGETIETPFAPGWAQTARLSSSHASRLQLSADEEYAEDIYGRLSGMVIFVK